MRPGRLTLTLTLKLTEPEPEPEPEPGRLLGSHADGTLGLFDSVNEDNDVTWFDIPEGAADDAAFAHGGVNGYDDRPMREYLVELK